jgi:hypothetical protein
MMPEILPIIITADNLHKASSYFVTSAPPPSPPEKEAGRQNMTQQNMNTSSAESLRIFSN